MVSREDVLAWNDWSRPVVHIYVGLLIESLFLKSRWKLNSDLMIIFRFSFMGAKCYHGSRQAFLSFLHNAPMTVSPGSQTKHRTHESKDGQKLTQSEYLWFGIRHASKTHSISNYLDEIKVNTFLASHGLKHSSCVMNMLKSKIHMQN